MSCKRANEILKTGGEFLRGGARPPTQEVVAFIDANRDDVRGRAASAGRAHLQVLQVAPSTLLRGQDPPARRRGPARRGDDPGAAAAVGGQLPGLRRPQAVEGGPPGRPRHRPGPGRPADARRRDRGCPARPSGSAPPDPTRARHGIPTWSSRDFTATAPNQLWVTDLTYVPTWAGVAYVCFIIDASRRMIVGWRVASHMRTTMVLDAIEMARWSRGTQLAGLRCHSDAGSQFTSIRYGERLAEIGAVPSIGTVGDSYDNALAETVNGYYKAELIRGPAREARPWKTVEDVELATLGWVHWHNTTACTATSATSHQQSSSKRSTLRNGPTNPWSKSNSPSLHQTQGQSSKS